MEGRRVEHLIVGGGVYGVATAWHLARTGAGVVLVDADRVGSGASGGLGKRGVRANGRDLRELPLMRIAHSIWPHLEAELGAPTGWERVGHLLLYEREDFPGKAEHVCGVQSAAGIPTTHLTAHEVLDIEPGLSDVVRGALHSPLDGVADHSLTTAAYAAAALEAGVEICEAVEVVSIDVEAGRARAVELSDGGRWSVEGDLLLLCNAGVSELVQQSVGRVLPVWPAFPQAMTTTPMSEVPFRSLFGHAHRRIALKTLPGGVVMASGGWRGVFNQGDGSVAADPDAVESNWEEALRLLPALRSTSVASVSVDRVETMSVDDIPIIDRLPEANNVLIGCGWSGHGWAIAPAVAPMLADWVTSGTVPSLLRPFSLERFVW